MSISRYGGFFSMVIFFSLHAFFCLSLSWNPASCIFLVSCIKSHETKTWTQWDNGCEPLKNNEQLHTQLLQKIQRNTTSSFLSGFKLSFTSPVIRGRSIKSSKSLRNKTPQKPQGRKSELTAVGSFKTAWEVESDETVLEKSAFQSVWSSGLCFLEMRISMFSEDFLSGSCLSHSEGMLSCGVSD